MKSVDPLQGKRVLITRAKSQVEGFIRKIEESGGVAISAPLLQIEANDSNEAEISTILNKLEDYHCIVFTSANGVTHFKHYLDKYHISYDSLQHFIAASVGRKTSEKMKDIGLEVSIVPEEFVAEKLAESISTNLHTNSKILVIRGNLARPTLVTELQNKGYEVTDLVVYKTVHNVSEAKKLQSHIVNDEIDYITFTSSSTVDSFMKVLNQVELHQHLKKLTFICIGPITNDTLKGYGFIGFMPQSYTIDDMVQLMIELEDN